MFTLVVKCLKTAIEFLSYMNCKNWMNFPQICFWLRVFQVLILPQYPTLPEHGHVAMRPPALHFCVRRMDENAQWDFLTSALIHLCWYQVCRKEAEALPAMAPWLATVLEMCVAGAGLPVAPSALGQLSAQPQAPEQRRRDPSLTSHLLC